MNIPKSDNCYQFGEYRLDITERTILRATEPVSLSPKSFDVLSILVQNGGRLLAKDYLLAAVWPGVTVEENSLAKAVAEIRKALGEGPRENRYVVTVARRGYRFIPTVTGWSTVRQENAPRCSNRQSTRKTGQRSYQTCCPTLYLADDGGQRRPSFGGYR